VAKSRAADTPDAAPAHNDAYTGMLGIALLALITGSVLLYLDYSQYDGKSPPPTPKYAVPLPGNVPAPAQGNIQPPAPMPEQKEEKKAEEKKAEEKAAEQK
jgi:hypothetical protein